MPIYWKCWYIQIKFDKSEIMYDYHKQIITKSKSSIGYDHIIFISSNILEYGLDEFAQKLTNQKIYLIRTWHWYSKCLKTCRHADVLVDRHSVRSVNQIEPQQTNLLSIIHSYFVQSKTHSYFNRQSDWPTEWRQKYNKSIVLNISNVLILILDNRYYSINLHTYFIKFHRSIGSFITFFNCLLFEIWSLMFHIRHHILTLINDGLTGIQ